MIRHILLELIGKLFVLKEEMLQNIKAGVGNLFTIRSRINFGLSPKGSI